MNSLSLGKGRLPNAMSDVLMNCRSIADAAREFGVDRANLSRKCKLAREIAQKRGVNVEAGGSMESIIESFSMRSISYYESKCRKTKIKGQAPTCHLETRNILDVAKKERKTKKRKHRRLDYDEFGKTARNTCSTWYSSFVRASSIDLHAMDSEIGDVKDECQMYVLGGSPTDVVSTKEARSKKDCRFYKNCLERDVMENTGQQDGEKGPAGEIADERLEYKGKNVDEVTGQQSEEKQPTVDIAEPIVEYEGKNVDEPTGQQDDEKQPTNEIAEQIAKHGGEHVDEVTGKQDEKKQPTKEIAGQFVESESKKMYEVATIHIVEKKDNEQMGDAEFTYVLPYVEDGVVSNDYILCRLCWEQMGANGESAEPLKKISIMQHYENIRTHGFPSGSTNEWISAKDGRSKTQSLFYDKWLEKSFMETSVHQSGRRASQSRAPRELVIEFMMVKFVPYQRSTRRLSY